MELRPELEQILTQLKLYVPATLLSDDALSEDNWNRVCSSITLLTEAIKKITHLPPDIPLPGSPYFRVPSMPVPWEKYRQTTKQQWIAVHERYPGDFMRLAGGNASAFKADGTEIYHDAGIKGEGGGQIDTMQEHQHNHINTYISDWSGTWLADKNYWAYSSSNETRQTENNTGRTAQETRPVNVTIELYIYTGEGV